MDNNQENKFNFEEEYALRRFSDPLFKGFKVCGPDFSVTFHKKKELRMRQSWAVGFSILDLSKLKMQSLMYEVVKPRFNGEASVLMSDTDSWVLAIPLKSPDEVVSRLSDVMDFSNYDPSHPLFSMRRKNLVGLLKNEVPRDTIIKFVGLRSKTYAFKTEKDKTERKAKGVRRSFQKKIAFPDYEQCLRSVKEVRVKQMNIQSKNHQNMLMEANKVAFSSFDDKRYLLCPIHSVPYGSVIIALTKMKGACFFCQRPEMLV